VPTIAIIVARRWWARRKRAFAHPTSFEGERIKRIDVYFGATYEDGVFVAQKSS
jgi:hypothetical protein